MVKKTLEYDFQTVLHSIAHLFTEYSLHVSEIRKRDQKSKNGDADFPFSQFSFVATLSHWYPDWVKVVLACFEAC